MLKTLGYYLLEKSMRKYMIWPTSHGMRGYGVIILIVINLVWGFYPLITELMHYKTNFAKLLFHLELTAIGAITLFGNIQLLRNRRSLLEIIDSLSDFNHFGIPERIKFIEKNIKIILNIIHYGGFFIGYAMAYYVMFENNCAGIINTKDCFIIEYFVPHHLKQYEITLIMLFQIYFLGISMNVIFSGLLLYSYSMELLIARIEHLNNVIDNIHLNRNKKRNFKILRPIFLYHQDIFRMFDCVKGFFVSYIVPTKVCVIVCLTMSTTEFVLEKNLISCWMIIMYFLTLFFFHTIGQRFITAVGSVNDAICNVNWFDSDVSTRKDVLLLLCMSQHTVAMEVPLFGKLSHTAAAKEYKMVYGFCNWILTVMKQRIV
ncbi:uncharacterized protein [Onthophagus taurus]|uniref:uncharacterized protein n=1 Tax=Onthophagus taurus TaxID=166361 RepID=UPI0039BEBE62